jgi:hypothetical protein
MKYNGILASKCAALQDKNKSLHSAIQSQTLQQISSMKFQILLAVFTLQQISSTKFQILLAVFKNPKSGIATDQQYKISDSFGSVEEN